LILIVLTGLAVRAASAQTTDGPLVLAPIDKSIVLGPDVKITTVDNATATLTGGYVAKLIEKRFLVGGAGYWLVDLRDRAHLGYGGLLLGWRLAGDDRVNVGVRGLAGFGQATIYRTVTTLVRPDFRHSGYQGQFEQRVGYQDVFLLAEPEIVVNFSVTSHVRLTAGGGYRVTTAGYGFNDLIRGPTVTISAQFDLGN
jgi:hypothetical protein